MVLASFVFIAILIIWCCIYFTTNQKMNRMIAGIGLMLSILTYPFTLALLFENEALKNLEGVGSLVTFYLILLLGGIITLIAGFFTKTRSPK